MSISLLCLFQDGWRDDSRERGMRMKGNSTIIRSMLIAFENYSNIRDKNRKSRLKKYMAQILFFFFFLVFIASKLSYNKFECKIDILASSLGTRFYK